MRSGIRLSLVVFDRSGKHLLRECEIVLMNQYQLRAELILCQAAPGGHEPTEPCPSGKVDTSGDTPNAVLAQQRAHHLGFHAVLRTHESDEAHRTTLPAQADAPQDDWPLSDHCTEHGFVVGEKHHREENHVRLHRRTSGQQMGGGRVTLLFVSSLSATWDVESTTAVCMKGAQGFTTAA